MAMNPNDIGKLTVMSDGVVYANLNAPVLGDIGNTGIRELIYRKLLEAGAG